jgi:enoyl-CoA hydratase/carnithine racemase
MRIKLQLDGPVPILVIDRPDAANSLDLAALDELESLLSELEHDRLVRTVLITGSGDRVFSAGGDIGQMRDLAVSDGPEFVTRGQQVLSRLAASRLISIAAIRGHALGGGAELALACDLRVMGRDATFGFPEVGVGLIPGWGGTQRALRIAGPAHAKLAILTGRRLSAADAQTLGLVDVVVPGIDVLSAATALAVEIASRSPRAVLASKRAIDGGLGLPIAQGLQVEADAWLENFATSDRVEGLTAFLERRPPRWRDA